MSVALNQNTLWDNNQRKAQRLTLFYQYSREWSLRFSINQQQDAANEDVFGNFQVQYVPEHSRIRSDLLYASQNNEKQINLEYVRNQEMGGGVKWLSKTNDDQIAHQFSADHTSHLFETRLNVDQTQQPDDRQLNYNIQFSTSIVMADGHLGISRPLRGSSFALFKAKSNLSENEIEVMRGFQASSIGVLKGSESHTVVPNLSAYYYNHLHLGLEKLPMDVTLERQGYDLLPEYRSGFYVEVGYDQQLIAQGVLQNNQGKPLALVVGQMFKKDNDDAALEFFTDRTGFFELDHLREGQYVIKLLDYNLSASVDIKSGSSNFIDLGEITLE